jgi:hypothetical protein
VSIEAIDLRYELGAGDSATTPGVLRVASTRAARTDGDLERCAEVSSPLCLTWVPDTQPAALDRLACVPAAWGGMVRVVPDDWGGEAALLPWLIDDLAGVLAHLRRPLLVDVHGDATPPWEGIARVASAFPTLPVVLGGGPRTEVAIARALCRACPNVLVESSWLDRRSGVGEMLREIGARRVVFGSGPAYRDAAEALASVARADCTPEQSELMLIRNAEQLLAGGWVA